jgi:hypothetical protein
MAVLSCASAHAPPRADIDAFDIIMTPPEDFFKDQGFKSRNESKRRLTIPASLDDASAVSGGPSEPAEDAQ